MKNPKIDPAMLSSSVEESVSLTPTPSPVVDAIVVVVVVVVVVIVVPLLLYCFVFLGFLWFVLCSLDVCRALGRSQEGKNRAKGW